MLHQEFESPEELRDAIKCFWYNRRDLENDEARFEVVPDGYAEIIFYFGRLDRVSENGVMEQLPSPFIMGLLNHPAVFYSEGQFEIIGVRCYPWTVFDLLGLSSVKDQVHVFEHPVSKLQPALSQCIRDGRVEDAINVVRKYFIEARANVSVDSMLSKAGVAMRKSNGTIAVSEIAAAAYATVRTLERNFKQSSGHTVKDVSALIRFEQVRNQLWMNPDSNLAGLAHELGYTDQSHLSREFKRFSGTTPAAFARNSKRTKLYPDDFVIKIE